MLFLTPTELIAIRDPGAFAVALGRLGDAWVIASETCAFDLIDAKYVRDIEPGDGHNSTKTAYVVAPVDCAATFNVHFRATFIFPGLTRSFRPIGESLAASNGVSAWRQTACHADLSCRCRIQACPRAIGLFV